MTSPPGPTATKPAIPTLTQTNTGVAVPTVGTPDQADPGAARVGICLVFVAIVVAACLVWMRRTKVAPYQHPSYKRYANVALFGIAIVSAGSFVARSIDRHFHELLDPVGVSYLLVTATILIWPSIAEFGKDGIRTHDQYWAEELEEDARKLKDEFKQEAGSSVSSAREEYERRPEDETDGAVPNRAVDAIDVDAPSKSIIKEQFDRTRRGTIASSVSEAVHDLKAALDALVRAAGIEDTSDRPKVVAKLAALGYITGRGAQSLNEVLDKFEAVPEALRSAEETQWLLSNADTVVQALKRGELITREQRLINAIKERAERADLTVSVNVNLSKSGYQYEADMVVLGSCILEVKIRKYAPSNIEINRALDTVRKLQSIAKLPNGMLVYYLPDGPDRDRLNRIKSANTAAIAWTLDLGEFVGTQSAVDVAPWLFAESKLTVAPPSPP